MGVILKSTEQGRASDDVAHDGGAELGHGGQRNGVAERGGWIRGRVTGDYVGRPAFEDTSVGPDSRAYDLRFVRVDVTDPARVPGPPDGGIQAPFTIARLARVRVHASQGGEDSVVYEVALEDVRIHDWRASTGEETASSVTGERLTLGRVVGILYGQIPTAGGTPEQAQSPTTGGSPAEKVVSSPGATTASAVGNPSSGHPVVVAPAAVLGPPLGSTERPPTTAFMPPAEGGSLDGDTTSPTGCGLPGCGLGCGFAVLALALALWLVWHACSGGPLLGSMLLLLTLAGLRSRWNAAASSYGWRAGLLFVVAYAGYLRVLFLATGPARGCDGWPSWSLWFLMALPLLLAARIRPKWPGVVGSVLWLSSTWLSCTRANDACRGGTISDIAVVLRREAEQVRSRVEERLATDPNAEAVATATEGRPGHERVTVEQALDDPDTIFKQCDKSVYVSGDVLFDYDSDRLKVSAAPHVRKLARLLAMSPTARVALEGHSDRLGDPDYNVSLSVRRAQAVANWLVDNGGLARDRIDVRGFGSRRPIVDDPMQFARNRRVEVRVVCAVDLDAGGP